MTKRQRTNNDISNTTQKIKDLGTRNSQKQWSTKHQAGN